jgi:hypothetical protein
MYSLFKPVKLRAVALKAIKKNGHFNPQFCRADRVEKLRRSRK